MRLFVSLIAGLLFGLGLTLSDMIDPARVLAFLDVASGAWDPTLAFVMGGAMIPMFIAWRFAARGTPAFAPSFPEPPEGTVDSRLVAGSALFGAGWGLIGFCPGPALAALGPGGVPVIIFVTAMLAGMLAYEITQPAAKTPLPQAGDS